ncbi:hypothetical protein D9M71_751970 [compost metagenome]
MHVVVIELADTRQLVRSDVLTLETRAVVAVLVHTGVDYSVTLEIVDPARTHLTDHALVEDALEVPVTISLPRPLESLTVTDQMVCSLQLTHFGLFNRYG